MTLKQFISELQHTRGWFLYSQTKKEGTSCYYYSSIRRRVKAYDCYGHNLVSPICHLANRKLKRVKFFCSDYDIECACKILHLNTCSASIIINSADWLTYNRSISFEFKDSYRYDLIKACGLLDYK